MGLCNKPFSPSKVWGRGGVPLTSAVSQELKAPVKSNIVKNEDTIVICGLKLKVARMLIVSKVKQKNK